MKWSILILCILGFITKCDPLVVFDTPQPANKANKESFNKKICGKYIDEDSTIMIIVPEMIVLKSKEEFEVTIEELDSLGEYSYNDSLIIGPILDTAYITKRKNDTLIGDYIFKDTIFLISESDVLKKRKKTYFLNVEQENKTWEVIQLYLHQDTLEVKKIGNEKEIEVLKSITSVEEIRKDSSDKVEQYIVKADHKEFISFIKMNGFKDIEKWAKIGP